MAKKSLRGRLLRLDVAKQRPSAAKKKAKPRKKAKIKRALKIKRIKAVKKLPAKHIRKLAKKPKIKKIIKPKIKARIAKHVKIIKPEKIKPVARAKAKKIKEAKTPAEKIAEAEKIPDEKAFELLKIYGIPTTQHFFVKKEADLLAALKKTGFPAVMKVSGAIVHKTDVDGVKIIKTENEAKAAFRELLKIKGCEKVLVQKFCSGMETIVGAKWDNTFGTIVVFGLGGIYAEVMKDVSFRVYPLALQDAESMVKEIKGYEILKGSREHKPINFSALYDVLIKVSKLAVKEKVKEMDLNPLFCNSEGCLAADVRIVKL